MQVGPRLDAVFDASPNPYMIVDRDLRFVAVNAAYCAATSRTREELLGKHLIDVFPHDRTDRDNQNARRLVASFERVFATGMPDVLALIYYRISIEGREVDRYWSATQTPLFDENNRVEYVLQHTTDVTELEQHRRSDRAAGMLSRTKVIEARNVELAGELQLLQRAFAGAPGFMCLLVGPEHVVELANEAYHQLVGGRPLIGRRLRDALPELDPRYFGLLEHVARTGEPYFGRGERVMLAPAPGVAPREVFVDFVYRSIIGADGQSLGVFVLGNDVTPLHVAEQEASFARREVEAIFEAFPESIFSGTQQGITRANERARNVFGYGSVEDLKRPIHTLIDELRPRDPVTGVPLTDDELPFPRALRGLETRREIMFSRFDTGEDRIVFASGAPVYVEGSPPTVVVTHIDITEPKKYEAEVRKLANVLDCTHDFVGISDLAGTPTFVNAAGLELVGLADLDAAKRLPVIDYVIESERELVRTEILPAVLRGEYVTREMTFLHTRTGEHIPVLCTVFPLQAPNGTVIGLATITRDLRADKAAQAERARLLEAERLARAQAEQANYLKDQFLATVSHELRTPLTSILGWMQMLRAGMVAPDKQARALETVERNARIQAQLIEDLLDVSRILSGKLELELETVELTAVIAAAIETIRPVAESKGVELGSVIDAMAYVRGDARRLQQVVWNLLSNAVKFTPSGGRVVLRLERRGNRAAISVTDTGFGIASEFLPHVFERFRQAEDATIRRNSGLGLGLSIVRHVVAAHGGQVRADSEGVGRGACFTVLLPRVAPLRAPPPRRVRLAPPPTLANRRIVIVDDEPDAREYIAALLREAKMEVTVTATAEDALAAVEHEHPDVLLSDIAMPGIDGYRLIEMTRALPAERGGRTPAIALTAFARAEDRTYALRVGFQNHVAKPIDQAELFAVLASVLPA